MKLFFMGLIQSTVENQKVAATVSAATVSAGSGLATYLNLIPQNAGVIASLLGAVLSIILIYTHVRKYRRDIKKHDLEMKLLHKKLLKLNS